MKNLFLGVALAPYRIDLYNYFYEHLNCLVFFQQKNFMEGYNLDLLFQESNYKPQYLETSKIGKRSFVRGLKRLIIENSPEFIFVPEFSILTLQVILLKYLYRFKYKIISFCDDSYDMILGNDFSLSHRLARHFVPRLLDDLILVDNKVVSWYKTQHGKGIWMPIIADEQRIRPKYERTLSLSNKLNEQFKLQGQKVILFVGRLVELKNVTTLLKAYSLIKNQARLVIIGDGPCGEDLKRQNDKWNTNVVFTGRLEGDELIAWYNVADIFVLPSVQEAFGAVVNEALLAGCYTLVSEKAGASCIIKEGINGEIFNPNSVEELSEKLTEVLKLLPNKSSTLLVKDNKMLISFQRNIKNAVGKLLKN